MNSIAFENSARQRLFNSTASFYGGNDLQMRIRHASGMMSNARNVWTGMFQ